MAIIEGQTTLIEWNSSLVLGIESIDVQHKLLVGYLNMLFEAQAQGRGEELLVAILKSLDDYARHHFSYEEGLLKKHGYVSAHADSHAAHIEEHSQFHDVIKVFKSVMLADDTPASLVTDVLQFLEDWIVSHILKTDKAYVPFLLEQGAQ